MSARVVVSVLTALLVAALPGCGEPRPMRPGNRDAGPGGGGDSGPGSGETGAQCSDGIDNDGDGVSDCDETSCFATPACVPDGGPGIDGGFMGCDAVAFEAETNFAPVDIIWIIDNSGSMDEETRVIQDNINSFAASISASGIDYHVIVITDPSAFGLSVPAPLGTDTTRFRLVTWDVQSADALTDAIASYAPPPPAIGYSDFLRPDAVTHFIHVTDDESSMSAADFRTQMTALLGHGFTSHVIASPPGSTHMLCLPGFGCIGTEDGCAGSFGEAADNGDIYWALAMATGGQRLSICSADWSVVFRTLEATIAVPMPIPCEFAIPEPPAGMAFDRTRVNVTFTPSGGGAPTTFPFVGTADGADCRVGVNGWYYDDPLNPTQIILCPSTCTLVEGDESARVDIALGCETIFG